MLLPVCLRQCYAGAAPIPETLHWSSQNNFVAQYLAYNLRPATTFGVPEDRQVLKFDFDKQEAMKVTARLSTP
jgi:hypothetical protein